MAASSISREAGSTNMRTLGEIYFPELQRAIQPLVDNDVGIIWHCDGNIVPIVDQLIDLGVSGLQGFQEEAGVPYQQMVRLESKWGRPLIIWGCVSVTTTLPFGAVEDVKAAVRRSFTLAGAGRGMRLARPDSPGVLDFFTLNRDDSLLIQNQKGKETEVAVTELPVYNRGAKGTVIRGGIYGIQVKPKESSTHGDDVEEETTI